MGRLRVESLVAFVVGILLLLGCALVVRSALAFTARSGVTGVVTAVGEQRDGQGERFSTATVAWQDATGQARELALTDPERFTFTVGQAIALKVDPEDPTSASLDDVGSYQFFGAVFGALGLFFNFVGVRGVLRARRAAGAA